MRSWSMNFLHTQHVCSSQRINYTQSGDLRIYEVMKYELSPYPTCLFESKNQLRKPEKTQLLDAIRSHTTCISDDAVVQSVPETEHYILDGGSLIYRPKWTDWSTYSEIADTYASFTSNNYGKVTIVFYGYDRGANIKDNTHQRRNRSQLTNRVDVTKTTKFVGKKEIFLSNDMNKQEIIKLILEKLKQNGCCVIQAEGDADVDIVKATLSMSSYVDNPYWRRYRPINSSFV